MSLRKFRNVLLYCLAGLLLLLFAGVLAVKLALDRAPEYQAQIKEWLHTQTGYHITFAHVSPSFRWYGPELHFDRLQLRSKDDARMLASAAGARVAIDIWQLLRSGKLLAGRIELDSPNIVIARVGPNAFALASEIELGGGDSSLVKLNLADLPEGSLVIRHGLFTLQNWNSVLPQLTLNDVNLNIRRGDGVSAALNARLPPVLGGTLNISGNARGLGDLKTLNWNVRVRTRDVSFPGWRLLLPGYLSRLDAGNGAFEFAAHGHGPILARADLVFAAAGVATKLSDGPSAKFEKISGSLSVTHDGERWILSGKKVRAQQSGQRQPDSEFQVNWRDSDAGLLDLRARASYLRLDTLLPLTGLLPDKNLRDRLREIAPTGEWTDTDIAMARDNVNDPWRLQVRAKFRDAGFAPVGGAPGLRGLTGMIAGNEQGGRVDIDTHTAVFAWPRQFPRPVDLDTLKTTLFWQRTAAQLLIATPGWEMRNRDAAVHARVAWQQPSDGTSPLLTMAATVENGNVADARNYLPRALLAPKALAWLDRALVSGHLSRADAVFRGPVKHFPFRDGSGLFLVRCALNDMTLDYQDGWPRVEDGAAQAEFRNEGLSVHVLAGHVGGIGIDTAEARFRDFKTGELEIHGSARSDAADVLAVLRATPLDALAEHAFSGVEAKGPVESQVDLFLPFKDFAHRRVLVHENLLGVTLNRPGSPLAATDVNGDVDIDGAQVAHADVHGRLLGGPFQMQARAARNRPVTRTQLEFHGTLSGDALHAALSLPAAMPINGQTEWRAILKMTPEPARERSLRVSSNLVGLELKLPAPLDKLAGTPLPSWLSIQWPAADGPVGKLALGTIVRGSYALESDANGLRLAHTALTFGADESSTGDAQIVNVGGSVERVDLGGWLKLDTPDKNAKPLADYLRSAKIQVAQLDYLGLSFHDVALDLAVNDNGLRIAVGGPNVVGTLSIPTGTASAEPWNLEFQRLKFVDDPNVRAANDANDGQTSAAEPHNIPAIKFHAADMIWDERQFGDVRATLAKLNDGIGLTQLTVASPDYTVSAKGEWRGQNAGTGRIEGTLTSTDVGATLKRLGYAEVIEAKSGHMDFDMNWAGAPTADALSDAAGRVRITLGKGQIVGLKPGAGRVLGLASVAELPRRLALDFSDLTDKGFAFDTAHGDFDLKGGNAYTDDVLVKGPAAEIGLIGRVGLKTKDYDQTAVVTGSLSSSPLPLAGFVGGPVLGAAVLVFTQVFKQPLKGLVRGYYRITGDWDNPTVERIKSADAAAATAEAPK